MERYKQAERTLTIQTPLGDDVLLPTGFRGSDAISKLFHYQVDLLAEVDRQIPFDQLIGAAMTVEMQLAGGAKSYFNGIVKRFSQGGRDEVFVRYSAELVPQFWLLTRRVRSRIFQHISIPDLLHTLFSGLNVKYELTATYYPRDYCVQYRESDFDFASRLMEEEGIYYFFQHSAGGHQMVVTDVPGQHPSIPGQNTMVYDELLGGVRNDMRITAWQKAQELRSGEWTLWDHCFEMPTAHLEARVKPVDSVTVGKVTHKLNVGGNDKLEIYDFPGGYAQRFDGIDRHGAPRPEDLEHVFADSTRTAKIRMEQEQAVSLEIAGAGDCGNFQSGHKFALQRHFDADGPYVLKEVEHEATQSGYRAHESMEFHYQNRFTCFPADLRYRPQRETRKPVIAGVQTATVVGPQGQEIFCDQYGRIKVQFHWDRDGKNDGDSSCWIRVSQIWAGKRWGAFFWPRIGHEVVVAFEEGDPDQPIVVGSVYNADNMPPMVLPNTNYYCGIKSASERGKAGENYNSVLFIDKKGQEHLAIHSERHMILNAEFDVGTRSGRHRSERVSGAQTVTVGRLPGTGGSGGGPTYLTPAGATVSGTTWAQPTPQAELGLDTKVVYGTSFTGSFPMSFQVALGGLLKLIVDPIGYQKAYDNGVIPPECGPLLASGAYGSGQLILGTSTNVTMGQAYNIIVGPEPVDNRGLNKAGFYPMAHVLGVIMECAAVAFLLAYGLLQNDDWRAVSVMTMQGLTQVCMAALVVLANSQNKVDKTIGQVISAAFSTVPPSKTAEYQLIAAAELALFLAPITPPLLDSIGEVELDARQPAPTPPSSSSSSGSSSGSGH